VIIPAPGRSRYPAASRVDRVAGARARGMLWGDLQGDQHPVQREEAGGDRRHVRADLGLQLPHDPVRRVRHRLHPGALPV